MPKNIVVCCDGTGNEITGHETNVLRLYRALERDEGQLTFYDPGVGTLADPMALTRWRKFVQRKLDATIGRSLCQNFSDAYRFVSRNYQEGDQIYLFGFSRGAYTARAVAGAIHMLGLLRPELVHLPPYLWAMYANDGEAYDVNSRFGGAGRFREMFCVSPRPRIRVVGVWDTVSSYGWFWDFQSLPYTANNPSVDFVRHALSLDERRAAFPANLFRDADGKPAASDRVKQVWFAGVHSDVGGGYADERGALSKIALQWMIEELRDVGGLRLRADVVDEILGATGRYSRPDPLAAANESLEGFWKVLEWVPRRQWHKVKDDAADGGAGEGARAGAGQSNRPKSRPLWERNWVGPHRGRPRRVPECAWLHPSVRQRLNSLPGGYHPPLPDRCVDIDYVPGRGYVPSNVPPECAPRPLESVADGRQ